jgi:hypothetical protein
VRGDGIDVNSGFGEELARIFDVVDTGRFERDVAEPGSGELALIVLLFESAGDAAYPEEHAVANLGVDLAANDDVGDGEATAGLEDAEGFAQDAVFIGGEVDDAVGDDDVD